MKTSYVAGFFDGEGSITITRKYYVRKTGKKVTYYRLLIHVGNTDKKIIEDLQKKYGGYIRVFHPPLAGYTKTFYRWMLCRNAAYQFLKKIEKYLRIKKERVKLAIEFEETVIHQRKSRVLGKLFKDKINLLNKRGTKND